MGKTLGIGMIEMYTKMVRDDFAPIISQLNARRTIERANMEITVRKELGIYNLTVKKFKLQAELGEIERQLKSYEEKTNVKINGRFEYESKIGHVVNAKMAEAKNGLLKETEISRNQMIKRIKLAGVHGDIKKVFDDMSSFIEPLQKQLKKLPIIKPLKALKAK
jgi:hypothetical protein